MFFNNDKENIKILDMLDTIESYLKDEINSLPEQKFVSSGYNKMLKNKLDAICNILNEKNNQELEIYGEIMLVSEKISNGILNDKIYHTNTSNVKLNYIAKTINNLVDALSNNMKEILSILKEYQDNNYINKLDSSKVSNDFKLLYEGINNLQNSIVQNFSDSKNSAERLEVNSNRLLDSMNKLTQNTNEAAASLEETAAALEEITSTTRSNTNNVDKMSTLSKTLSTSAEEGTSLANETTVAMQEISNEIASITDATSVIDQIAFQTNILSLNAAVEAATAGEAGKGFAVVAQEVRNLANRSAEAAKEIKEIVSSATIKSNTGIEITDKMITGYEHLNDNISETIALISNLEVASEEQLNGIEEINKAVSLLDSQTQENAHIADQALEVARDVENQSKVIVDNMKDKSF